MIVRPIVLIQRGSKSLGRWSISKVWLWVSSVYAKVILRSIVVGISGIVEAAVIAET